MIHTLHCIRCNAAYEAACFTFMHNEKGEFVNAYEVESYRRLRASLLCSACFVKLDNVSFEVMFMLQETRRILDKQINEAEKAYKDSLVKTPERIEAETKQQEAWDLSRIKFGFGVIDGGKTEKK